MAMVIPGTWTAVEPLDFLPLDDTLRVLMTEWAFGGRTGTKTVAECVNYLLANHFVRNQAMWFKDEPTWTTAGYVAGEQIQWRQASSPGSAGVDYRLLARGNGTSGSACIRIEGATAGSWVETCFTSDSTWKEITIAGVNASDPYFTVTMQGKIDDGTSVEVRSIGWRENPLTAIPTSGIDGVSGCDALVFGDDLPMSAGAWEDVVRTVLWAFDRRTRACFHRIMPGGFGSHSGNPWGSAVELPILGAYGSLATMGRAVVKPAQFRQRQLRIYAEGLFRGGAPDTGTLRVADRQGGQGILSINWTHADAGGWTWKTGDLVITRWNRQAPDGMDGTQIVIDVNTDVQIRNVMGYATDTNERF